MDGPPKRRKFELHNFNLIQKSCEMARLYARFFAVIGTPGIGKTVALKHYMALNRKWTKYIWIRETMTTKDFLRELAGIYGYSPFRGNHRFLTWLAQYHALSEETELLIIDEGGRFTIRQYSLIHELRDLTLENLGIVMSAPNYFIKKLQRWSDSAMDGIPEFQRRLDMVIPLENLTVDEIKAVCADYGIKDMKTLKSKYLHIKTIGELIKKIEEDLFFGRNLG